MIDAKKIMLKYYDEDSDLFKLLWKHSNQVADLSCEIAKRYQGEVDIEFVREAALLHDIGILKTHAPSILCNGTKPYLQHGIIGGEMLRREGLPSRVGVRTPYRSRLDQGGNHCAKPAFASC